MIFSLHIGPSPKKATKKSGLQTLDEIAKQPIDDCWKHYGMNVWMRRCKDPKTDHPFWMWGVAKDDEAEPTTNTFTCDLKPRKQPSDFERLNQISFEIMWQLAKHQEQAKCDCDIEWMIRRETKQKTLRVYARTPDSMITIWELMDQHDRLCSCGCFRQSKDEQSWEMSQDVK